MGRHLLLIIFCIFFTLSGHSQSIFEAIRNNNLGEVNKLSRKKKNLDTIHLQHGTPLMAAVSFENFDAIKLLLTKEININERVSIWRDGYKAEDYPRRTKRPRLGYKTAIDFAAENNNTELVKYLFENGALLHSGLLSVSIEMHNYDLSKFLINKGVFQLMNYKTIGESIFLAYNLKEIESLKYIIKHRSDDNCLNDAILLSLEKSKPELLYFLLRNSSLKEYFYSETFKEVIFYVISKSNEDVFYYLLKNINVNIIDKNNYTALDYAIINKNQSFADDLNSKNFKTGFSLNKEFQNGKQIVYFNGSYICKKENAFYYAYIEQVDTTDLWKLSKYYNNGERYMTGYYSDSNLINANGLFTYFYNDSLVYLYEKYINNKLTEKINPNSNIISDTTIYMHVDEMPEFPGGIVELRRYLANHVKYPAIAREGGIQGTVYLRFEVKWNGEIGRINLQKGVDPLLDEIAVETIKKLPRFKPGLLKGIPVNVWFSVPVRFELN